MSQRQVIHAKQHVNSLTLQNDSAAAFRAYFSPVRRWHPPQDVHAVPYFGHFGPSAGPQNGLIGLSATRKFQQKCSVMASVGHVEDPAAGIGLV